MTKSEAKVIHALMCETERKLQGVELPWAEMPAEIRNVVALRLKEALFNVGLVYEMAAAELGIK